MSRALNPFLPPPRPDRVERVASALSFVLFVSAWAVAYTVVCPPDPQHARHAVQHVARIEVVR